MLWPALVILLGAFVALHLVPFQPRLRARLRQALGPGVYRLAFTGASVASLVGAFVLADAAPVVVLWQAGEAGRWLALFATSLAFVLLAAAYLGREGWRLARHPMLAGVAIWAAAHVLATGTLGHVLTFGSLTVYAFAAMTLSDRRLAAEHPARWAEVQRTTSLVPFAIRFRAGQRDGFWLGAPAVGLGAWLGVLVAHSWLFGPSALPALLAR